MNGAIRNIEVNKTKILNHCATWWVVCALTKLLLLLSIELLVVYYSGVVVKSESKQFARKRNLGLVLDRVGLLNDLAFVMKDESLYPVAKLQLLLAKLNGMIKRKLLIIDGRLLTKTDIQIEIPIIPEESLDGLSTIYTIYPK